MVTLGNAFLQLRSAAEVQTFLRGVLAPNEVRHAERRWTAAQLLLEERPQREVSKAANLAIASVSKAAAAVRRNRKIFKDILSRETVVTPLDYCSTCIETKSLDAEVADVLRRNVRSALLSQPIEERCPLPPHVKAVMAQFGDARAGMYLIQVAKSEQDDSGAIAADSKDATSAQLEHLKLVVHELKHIVERYEDKIQRLEEVQRTSSPTLTTRPFTARSRRL